jgi:hypothetical protein
MKLKQRHSWKRAALTLLVFLLTAATAWAVHTDPQVSIVNGPTYGTQAESTSLTLRIWFWNYDGGNAFFTGDTYLTIDGNTTVKLNGMWSTFTTSNEDDVKKKSGSGNYGSQGTIYLNNTKVGTAQFKNLQKDQGGASANNGKWNTIDLVLSFNENFSFYGHRFGVKGQWHDYCDSDAEYTSEKHPTVTISGYPRATSVKLTRNDNTPKTVTVTWDYERYDIFARKSGEWHIFRNGNKIGTTRYSTKTFTDNNVPIETGNRTYTYTVSFCPKDMTITATRPAGLYSTASFSTNLQYVNLGAGGDYRIDTPPYYVDGIFNFYKVGQTVSIKLNDAYKIIDSNVSGLGGASASVASDKRGFSFTMPSSSINNSIKATLTEVHTISGVPSNLSLSNPYTTIQGTKYYKSGAEYTISPTDKTKTVITSCTAKGATVSNVSGAGATLKINSNLDGNVTVTATTANIYSVSLGNRVSITSGSPAATYDGIAYFTAGTQITLGTDDGLLPNHYIVNGSAISGNTFTMPAKNTTVSVNATDLWGVMAGANGSSAKPYVITTTAGLDRLAEKVNSSNDYVLNYAGKYFELGADIAYDRSVKNNYTPIGEESKFFSGHFDGKGHKVSGININKNSEGYKGIFGNVSNNDGSAEIKNVTIDDSYIEGRSQSGGIVGNSNKCTVTNCHATASVTIHGSYSWADAHGGIVGYNNRGRVIGCTSSANVTAGKYSDTNDYISGTNTYGGIVGNNYYGTVENCLVYGGTINGRQQIGAVVGQNWYGSLSNNRYSGFVSVKGKQSQLNLGVGTDSQDGADFACAIAPYEGVTLNFSLGTPTTEYDYNGLKIYPTGMSYDGKYYNYLANGDDISGDITFTATYTGVVPEEHIVAGFGWASEADQTKVNMDWTATDGSATCTLNTYLANNYYIAPSFRDISWGTGDGSKDHPYIITSVYGMNRLAREVNNGTTYSGKYVEPGANITYDKTVENNYTPVGNGNNNQFCGNFDGKGYAISGININNALDNQAVFGCVNGGTIQNLTLSNSTIRAGREMGGIVGKSTDAVINCHVTADVTLSGTYRVGGIAGESNALIKGCTSAATVSCSGSGFGGVAGYLNVSGKMQDCLYYGNQFEISGIRRYGALAGYVERGGALSDCYSTADMAEVNCEDHPGVHRAVVLDSKPSNMGKEVYTYGEGNYVGITTYENGISFNGKYYFLAYTISLAASPADYGNVTGSDVYKKGERVTVVAMANEEYEFVKWTDSKGVTVSTDAEFSFVATADSALTANFDLKHYTLTATVKGIYFKDAEYHKITSATRGQVVRLTVDREILEVSEGKYLAGYETNVEGVTVSDYDVFTMPAQNVTAAPRWEDRSLKIIDLTDKMALDVPEKSFNLENLFTYVTIQDVETGETMSFFDAMMKGSELKNGVRYLLDLNLDNEVDIQIERTRTKKEPITLIYQVKRVSGADKLTSNYTASFPSLGLYYNDPYNGVIFKFNDEFESEELDMMLFPLANNSQNNSFFLQMFHGEEMDESIYEGMGVYLQGRTLWCDGDWNTICLPFEVDLTDKKCTLYGAIARTLESATLTNDGQSLKLNFGDPVETLEAGVPYIIKWAASDNNIVNPVFKNVTIDLTEHSMESTEPAHFFGTYDKLTFETENQDILFLGSNNKLYYPDGKAATNIGACRAYFRLGAEMNATQIRDFILDFDDEGTVTIQNAFVQVDENGDAWFSLEGVKSQGEATQKGLLINNNKKVFIK